MVPFFINDVPIECINHAALTYHVPATMIISILKTEGGKNGMKSPNTDGTYDYGPMQINTRWLNTIARYGYTENDLRYDPCANVFVGTWILASNIADGKTIWNGVGNYHSHTPHLNATYSQKVQNFHTWLVKVIDPANKNKKISRSVNLAAADSQKKQ